MEILEEEFFAKAVAVYQADAYQATDFTKSKPLITVGVSLAQFLFLCAVLAKICEIGTLL